MRSVRHVPATRASRIHLTCAFLLASGMLLQVLPILAFADQPLPTMTLGYQSGTITGIYETSFQIDGRTFTVTPDAVIQDDKGKLIETSALVVTAEVKYHLKKDQNDKIDRMVVYLPR